MIVVLAALLFAAQLSSDARYLRMFRATGGSGFWTEEVYQIADYVIDRNPSQLVVMDWGFSNPMRLLVQGRVPMDEYYAEQDLSHLADLIRQPNVLFLQHAEGFDAYGGGRTWLEQAATQAGATCRPIRNFYQRDGRLVAYMAGCDLVRSSPDQSHVSPGTKTKAAG